MSIFSAISIASSTSMPVANGEFEPKVNGRDRQSFGVEGWLRMTENDPQLWRNLSAGMVMLYPKSRTSKFDDHITTLRRFKEVTVE